MVESENDGVARSTRSLFGAQPLPLSVPHLDTVELEPAAVDVVELVDVPGLLSFPAVVSAPHAPTTARPAASVSATTPRARGLTYLLSIVPALQSLPFAWSSPCGDDHLILVYFHLLAENLAVAGVHDHLVELAIVAGNLDLVDHETALAFELYLPRLAGNRG